MDGAVKIRQKRVIVNSIFSQSLALVFLCVCVSEGVLWKPISASNNKKRLMRT